MLGIDDFPHVPEVVEDGSTFAENAAKKATETARASPNGRWAKTVVSKSPRSPEPRAFSRPASADRMPPTSPTTPNCSSELAAVPDERRNARYVCNAALADPSGKIALQVEAYCHGRITSEARGTNGFGYDPYFLFPNITARSAN